MSFLPHVWNPVPMSVFWGQIQIPQWVWNFPFSSGLFLSLQPHLMPSLWSSSSLASSHVRTHRWGWIHLNSHDVPGPTGVAMLPLHSPCFRELTIMQVWLWLLVKKKCNQWSSNIYIGDFREGVKLTEIQSPGKAAKMHSAGPGVGGEDQATLSIHSRSGG